MRTEGEFDSSAVFIVMCLSIAITQPTLPAHQLRAIETRPSASCYSYTVHVIRDKYCNVRLHHLNKRLRESFQVREEQTSAAGSDQHTSLVDQWPDDATSPKHSTGTAALFNMLSEERKLFKSFPGSAC